MPARSFIGSVEEAARRFYATVMRGEVSDANVRGYLRAASQIEDVWGQIDDELARRTSAGAAPWDAYAALRYPLAFIRAARTYQVFVRELLAADAAFDPESTGYLPRVTYDQANALCHEIQPNLERAVAALTDPSYEPDVTLPLELGPRVEAEHACPVAHLRGMVAAAREVREWAAGLAAQYENAVRAAGNAPAAVTAHVAATTSRLAQADAALRFGVDLVGEVAEGRATDELHERAEDSLWEALQGYFLVNQTVAAPDLLQPASSEGRVGRPRRAYHDRRIEPRDLWRVAAASARHTLRRTDFGRDEMEEMCQKMGGILSAGAQQYLDDVEAAVRRGDAYQVAAMANCPFEPLYKARRDLDLAGARVPAGHEFHWNFHRGHIEAKPRFSRVDEWQECEE